MSLLNVFEQKQGESYWRGFQKSGCTWKYFGLLEQKAYGIPECLVEAPVTYEIYNSCLTNVDLPQQCNSSHVSWKWYFHHTKEFEVSISHNMSVFFILKAHFAKKTATD